jgi:hypothetical protein
MVRTFLKVYMEIGSYFLFLQEQIKDIIIVGNRASAKSSAEVCPWAPRHETLTTSMLVF